MSYFEFASHILIPLSIVKQRPISYATTPAGRRQNHLNCGVASRSATAFEHTQRGATSQVVGTSSVHHISRSPRAGRHPASYRNPRPKVPRYGPPDGRHTSTRKTSRGAAYYTGQQRGSQGLRVDARAAATTLAQQKTGSRFRGSPSSAPSRNRTENLLIKSQLL
jgi:hypothetical protein